MTAVISSISSCSSSQRSKSRVNMSSYGVPPSSRKKSIFGGISGLVGGVAGCDVNNKKAPSKVEHIVVYLPAKYPSCPPGLEKLIPVDHLFVRQGIREPNPPYTMISKNKLEILDGEGRRIFMAKDSADNILKLCCRGGCGQPFRMSIKEKSSGYEILAVNSRPDCYGAMSASISQNGMNLGFLHEDVRCCSSNYIVIDAQGTEIFRIYDISLGSPFTKKEQVERKGSRGMMGVLEEVEEGVEGRRRTISNNDDNPNNPLPWRRRHVNDVESMEMQELGAAAGRNEDEGEGVVVEGNSSCICGWCCKCLRNNRYGRSSKKKCGLIPCIDSFVGVISGGAEFGVYSSQLGVVVGRMGKQWDELVDYHFNLTECFGVGFPRGMSVRHKALLLGSLLVLDFNHFQL